MTSYEYQISYSSRDTIKKVKTHRREKIFANQISEKGPYPEVTPLLKFNKKTNNLTKKQVKDLNKHFSKEDIQMANKHKEGGSKSSGKCRANP